MSELFKLNNNIRTSGIFRRADPLQFRFLYTIDDPDRRSLIYFPVFYWNRADDFMAGVAINNGTLIPKPVEYFLFLCIPSVIKEFPVMGRFHST